MPEKEPQYFIEFKKEIFRKLDSHENQIAKIDTQITEIVRKLETHEDQIAKVSEQITGLDVHLKRKSDREDHETLTRRVSRLEHKFA